MKIVKKIKNWFYRRYAMGIVRRVFRLVDRDIARIQKQFMELLDDEKTEYWKKDKETFGLFTQKKDDLLQEIWEVIMRCDLLGDMDFLTSYEWISGWEHRFFVELPIEERDARLKRIKDDLELNYDVIRDDCEFSTDYVDTKKSEPEMTENQEVSEDGDTDTGDTPNED